MYLSEILSSFICGKPDFDPQVRYLAKRSIVDTMGAMLAGSCTDVVKQLLPVYNAPRMLYAGGAEGHCQRQQRRLPQRHQRPRAGAG